VNEKVAAETVSADEDIYCDEEAMLEAMGEDNL